MEQRVLAGLNPERLWAHFENICAIPHPSKKEAKLVEYILNFAKKHQISAVLDEIGNIILRKSATKGMEARKIVLLQAHIDMVPQKNSDTAHNFEIDPIIPFIEGEWVKARGTTLGSDNGIGVAAALAVLESTDIAHGPIEVLLTIDEEAGMTGAFGIKPGFLHADYLFNLDSEDEGELCVGCAGGIDTNAFFRFNTYATPENMAGVDIVIRGLKGGHSGCDIARGRGNAIKVLARVLFEIGETFEIGLAKISGGSLRNAIPREAEATIVVEKPLLSELLAMAEKLVESICLELGDVETEMKISLKKGAIPPRLIDKDVADRLVGALYSVVNGVVRMNTKLHGSVETSSNIGVVTQQENMIVMNSLQRSSVESAKRDVANMVRLTMEHSGAQSEHRGSYPGWRPNLDSQALALVKRSYKKLFNQDVQITVTHGGLECGLIGAVYPKMEMISFGPTIRFPHSPDEQVHIGSVAKFWQLLVHSLEHVDE